MVYEHHKSYDEVAAGRGAGGAAGGPGGAAGVLVEVLAEGLHPAPAVRHPRPEDVPQDRLQGRHPAPGGLRRAAPRPRAGGGAPLLHPLLRRRAAKKGENVLLLASATARAKDAGLIGDKPTAAVDATGLESRHTSRYFFKRAGRKHTSRLWTKLAAACDAGSHFIAGASVSLGPANDSPQMKP